MSATTLVTSLNPPRTLPYVTPDDDQVTTPLDSTTPDSFLPPTAKPAPSPLAAEQQSQSARTAAYLQFLTDCDPFRVVDDGHESDSEPEKEPREEDPYEGRGGAEAKGEAGSEGMGGAHNDACTSPYIQEEVVSPVDAASSQPTLYDPTPAHGMAGSSTISPNTYFSSSNLLYATPPLSSSLLSSSILSRPPPRRQTSTYYQAAPSLATPRRFGDSKQDVALTALLAEKDPHTRRWTRALAKKTKFRIEASVDKSMLERDLRGEVDMERRVSWPSYEVCRMAMEQQQVPDQRRDPVKMQREPAHSPKKRAHFATGSIEQLDNPPQRAPSPPTPGVDPQRLSSSQDTLDDGHGEDAEYVLQRFAPSRAAPTQPCQPCACPQPQPRSPPQQQAPTPALAANYLLAPAFIQPQHILKAAGPPDPATESKRRVRYAHRSSSRLGVHPPPAAAPQTPSPTPSAFFAACARADAKATSKKAKDDEKWEGEEEGGEEKEIAGEVEWKSRRIVAGLQEWFAGWTLSSSTSVRDDTLQTGGLGEEADGEEVMGGMNARDMESLCPIAGVQVQFY
ncbi:hypothetical protein IAR50_006106 [Cryptococcus sp. DSM 104548]